tara:strand:- start:3730 stop:5700 length:1971 start_codon:yes stop_codon:yes gene_type:complete
MALFKSRTIQEILNDAVNYVHYNTQLTDFNVGSVIRTLLEAMSIEDSEQYTQMENILRSFFLDGTSGSLLDDRAAQFDVARKSAQPSTGFVRFLDTELRRTFLLNSTEVGDTTIHVQDASVFPTSNFTVRLGEGTASVETVNIASVNTNTNVLTLGTAVIDGNTVQDTVKKEHTAAGVAVDEIDNLGSLVSLVTGESDRVIPAGILLRSKPTNSIAGVEALTKGVGTHTNGNFASSLVPIVTTTLGTKSVLSVKALNSIIGSPPFNGAEVVNLDIIGGGSDLESDGEFRQRIRDHISSLGKGTVVALTSALLQVRNTSTSQAVQRAAIIEDFESIDFDADQTQDFKDATVLAFINDGSSNFFGDELNFAGDTLKVSTADSGSDNLKLFDVGGFPAASKSSRQFIVVYTADADAFITSYSNVDSADQSLQDLEPVLTQTYPINTIVYNLEAITENSIKNRKYYTLSKTPLTEDALDLYTAPGIALNKTFPTLGNAKLLVENTDYLLNKGTGQIEFLQGKIPEEGTAIFARYTVFTGLVKTAQSTLDGNLDDVANFPGVRSAGVKVLVRPALNADISVSMDLSIDSEITNFETASFLVGQFVTSYINNLGIGQAVILAEIIERAMSVEGVTNVKILSPEGDIPINYNQVPVVNQLSFI